MQAAFDLRGCRRQVEAELPDPEVSATASSTFTLGHIEAALRKLDGRNDQSAQEQRAFLIGLRAERGAK